MTDLTAIHGETMHAHLTGYESYPFTDAPAEVIGDGCRYRGVRRRGCCERTRRVLGVVAHGRLKVSGE